MPKHRLLIVEDDIDIGNMLKIYFRGAGYDVDLAVRGSDALEKIRQVLPHLVILDIMLPDIDGYEVCRVLREDIRTNHICVIFLTQKDERSDKLQGFELGADDYVTKPFDIDKLKVRVYGAIRRSERENLTDPRSGLPSGRLIEEQLRRIIHNNGWGLLDISINYFEAFQDCYGTVASEDVLSMTATLMSNVLYELGTSSDDFLGHVSDDNFIVITSEEKAFKFKSLIKERFSNEVRSYYTFMDQQQGFIRTPSADGAMVNIPFMAISAGIVSHKAQSFIDTREIIELAMEARRQDSATIHLEEWKKHNTFNDKGWTYIHLRINHFGAYQDVYGTEKSNEVVWLTSKMIKDVMSTLKLADSFIGHEAKDKFVVILPEKFTQTFCEKLKLVFNTTILSHYHYIHCKQGYIRTDDQKNHPFMNLTMGMVHSKYQDFADIGRVAELAENACSIDE